MPDYDVIVIGAGNGGLTASLSLARSGLKVMLLERHNIPGGCATSFMRGRFEFEVALHQLSGLGTEEFPGPLRGTLADLGVMDELEFVRQENLYRVAFPGKLDLTLKADRLEVQATLKDRFPDHAGNIDRFFDMLYDYCSQWIGVAFMRDPEASPEKYPIYFKYALKTTQEVFDEYLPDPLLQAVVGAYWGYLGLPPSKLPFGDFAVVLWAYIEFKPFHIKGGSQALSSALLNAYLEAGGEVRFNCGAKRIMVSDGAVRGVVTEDGDEISADRIVSNAGTYTTYVELIDPDRVPDWRMREMGASTVGTSAVTLYIGFDREPAEMDVNTATNFMFTTLDADRAYGRFRSLNPPAFVGMSCYDVDDPDFSPPGTCHAAGVTLAYAEPWLRVPPDEYAEAKYRYAGYMLDVIYQVFPKCRNHIEEIEVGTPLTHMRYLGHPGGAIYGFDQYAKDSDLFIDRSSPIAGLYHTGAWVGMGGFQPTLMSGHSAARAVIKSLKA